MPKTTQAATHKNPYPTYLHARKAAEKGVKKHKKAETTAENYRGHICRGREFFEKFVLEESEAEELWNRRPDSEANIAVAGENQLQLSGSDSDRFWMHPKFREAFTGPPIECTLLAISMFMAFKCHTLNREKSTASAIHAAFIQHYDQLYVKLAVISRDRDKFRGKWHYDNHLKEWVGNPVRSAEVEDQLAAYMRCLLDHSLQKCPTFDLENGTQAYQKNILAERATYLLFNALSTSAFTIWMRIGEVTSLQYKNLEFPVGRQKSHFQGHHYFRLNLRNRKNWQKREKNGEHQLSGHTYMVYSQPRTPKIDMHRHLLDWLEFYETVLLGRPLLPDDFLFPMIGISGTSVQPDCAMTSDIAQKKINQMAMDANIHGAQYFTTHCFRRGGAQYRFMFAPLGERWTLARIRWWGGWATGEHRDTLIRYLLDELYTYEEDHSNALCPADDSPNPDLAFSSHEQKLVLNAAPTTNIVAGFTRQVTQQISTLCYSLEELRRHSSLSVGPTLRTVTDLDKSKSPVPRPPLVEHSHQFSPTFLPGGPPHHFSSQFSLKNTAATNNMEIRHLIPGFPRKLASKAFEQVVKDWEMADPSRSLYVPMKDWDPEWHKRSGQSQKYGQRQTVALEFID
uniref:Tyr recombinase domain-containing protein n=1 Tax=Psilocybe cubensis TaxID=181762 RepID=A0A8H7XPI1_PSICU